MSPPIRIQARREGALAQVRILMPHPMETGLRRDERGQSVPAHHITEVSVSLGERLVFAARMSIAVSRDPLIQFRVAGAEAGDTLRVAWTDSRGERRSDVVTLA